MRNFRFVLLALVLTIPCFSAAGYETQSFPTAHELFSPLQADPAEPHFGFQLGFPVSHTAIARIDIGDYLGLYRWALDDVGVLQLNVGGAINTRFDATSSHNLQVVDFYGNVPLDLRIKWFSLRSMFYHDSSHLGDDYLRENNLVGQSNSWEAWRETLSVQVYKALRFYGGYQQAIHTKPNWSGRKAIQGGSELYFNTSEKSFWHSYWANDVQAWERSNWDVTWISQIGFKTGDAFSKGRGISYFVQFKMGPRYEGQFYQNKETIWGAGLKFVLSDHLFQASPTPEIRMASPSEDTP
ncbi:MAG: DUF1207 domain-containing protein [Elusimicrobiota bacterium]